MRKNNFSLYAVLTIACLLSGVVWFAFSYPQMAVMNFSTDKAQAVRTAKKYLARNNVNLKGYHTNIVFEIEDRENLFLQKTLGFSKMKQFINDKKYDLYYWKLRFFNPGEKEEYRFDVSSTTGKIIKFKHIINDSAMRITLNKPTALKNAQTFATKHLGMDLARHHIFEDYKKKLDNRTDFTFVWEKKDVQIPWQKGGKQGMGKLLNLVKVSGQEILTFKKDFFLIPDSFKRHLEHLIEWGRGYTTVARLFYFMLLCGSAYFLIIGHQHLCVLHSKSFYLKLTVVIFTLNLISVINQLPNEIYNYNTATSYVAYIMRFFMQSTLNMVIISFGLILPALAGEYLCEKVKDTRLSLLYTLRTSFFTRPVAKAIGVGYILFLIMLGIQAFIIKIGQDHMSLWVTHMWVEQLSTSHWPFISAVAISLMAACSEEFLYRYFAINWGKRIFKNAWVPIILSSLIWGFAHSNYPVFPKWFRGMELSFIGFFLGWAYLRFGLIPIVVAHFLFDIFWNCAGFLFGASTFSLFSGSLLLLALPGIFACVAAFVDAQIKPEQLEWKLNENQMYNCRILQTYLTQLKNGGTLPDKLSMYKELSDHGWDIALIETAFKEFYSTEDNALCS